MTLNKIIILFQLVVLISACGATQEEIIATGVAATSEAVYTKEVYVLNAIESTIAYNKSLATETPTITPSPAATSTLTPTITPTQVPEAEVVKETTIIRACAGYNCKQVKSAFKGELYELVGKSLDGNWIKILVEIEIYGWAIIDDFNLNTSLDQISIKESPPTPLPAHFYLTIVNNTGKEVTIYFNHDYKNHSVIRIGSTSTIQIPSGYIIITIRHDHNSTCPVIYNQYISKDLYWAIPENNLCNTFPKY